MRLLAVEGLDRRTAWIYEDDGSVSVDAILARFGILPQRLGPALVAAVADVIEPLAADGWFHPGVTAADIRLGADGSVKVAGWVGPFGQIPALAVVAAPGLDDAALLAWCRERLGLRAPRKIVRVDALPRNALGKVLRREIAASLREPRE